MLTSGIKYVVFISCSLTAVESRADELQNRLLQGIKSTNPEGYSFQRSMILERTGSARRVLVERYNPRGQAGQRWSLVSVDGHAPSPKDIEQSRKSRKGTTPSYRELAEWFGAPAVRTDTAPGYVTYRFSRLPAGVIKIGSHDASADTQAEAEVNVKGKVPFVERVRFTSTKNFRIMMVASVQSIDISARYVPLSSGSIVPAASASIINGSMLGKSGRITTAVTFGSFEAVR